MQVYLLHLKELDLNLVSMRLVLFVEEGGICMMYVSYCIMGYSGQVRHMNVGRIAIAEAIDPLLYPRLPSARCLYRILR